MIGKGVGARQGNAAGAMGEAFGDFDALAAFNELHLPVPAGADRYTEGAYATGNPYNGIRDFLAGRPMGGEFPEPGQNPDTDPLNYGDFGFDNVGPEVHADGEIWVAVQMDLRDLFLSRNPSPGEATDIACARGQIAPSACPGDRRWIQDYYDAMVMMPRNTTMIQARDAMLAADLGRFGGGDNQDLLWQGFAMRGFGQHQSTVSNADTNPVPDFSSPLANNATLNFFADTKDEGRPGPGEREDLRRRLRGARRRRSPTPIRRRSTPARTPPATSTTRRSSRRRLRGRTRSLPRGRTRGTTYNFVAVAPGYGFVRFSVKHLKPGQTRNVTIHFATNYASATQGATIIGRRARHEHEPRQPDRRHRVDERRPDRRAGRAAAGSSSRSASTSRVSIDSLGVSALLVPGNNRFTALRSFDALRVHGRQGRGEPDLRRLDRRGLEADRQVPGRRVPVRQPAARHPGRDAAVLRRERRRTAGDAREVRRQDEPVHRSAVLRGRPGQRPEQQLRLPRHHARDRGARHRVAGVRARSEGRGLEGR